MPVCKDGGSVQTMPTSHTSLWCQLKDLGEKGVSQMVISSISNALFVGFDNGAIEMVEADLV